MAGSSEIDQVVAEQHAEPLVSDRRPCRKDRVTEPHGLLLPDADQAHHVADAADLREQVLLVLARERVLQLVAAVEVVLDRRLAAPVHQDDLVGARLHRLLDDQLHGGRVDDGEHLLRHGLGRGEEPRSQACGGDDDLAQRMLHGARKVAKGSDAGQPL